MMKLITFVAIVAVASADVSHLFNSPRHHHQHVQVPVAIPVPVHHAAVRSGQSEQNANILRYTSDVDPNGSYQWAIETDNGINAQEQGTVNAVGPEQVVKSAQGSFSYTSPEGVPVSVQYIADENGYQPNSDILPTPPPVPAAIARALEYIAAHPQREEPLVQQKQFLRF